MSKSVLSRNIVFTKAMDQLINAQIGAGRYTNTSEAVRDAVWQAFGPKELKLDPDTVNRLLEDSLGEKGADIPLEQLR